MSACKNHLEAPYRGYCPCVACELEKKDEEIARLKAELETANRCIQRQKSSFLMAMQSSTKATFDTAKLLADAERVAAGRPDLVDSERAANEILTNELADLRRKVGEWADLVADGYSAPLNEMREEAGK